MNEPRERRINARSFASRWMLPLEIWMAGTLIAAALSVGGYLGAGRLYEAASEYSSPLWCFVFMKVVAVCTFIIGGVELTVGRQWDDSRIMKSVSIRCVLAFVSVSLWSYVTYLLLSTPIKGAASPFVIIAPWCVVGNVVAYYFNFKVRCLLNPAVSTWRLECELLADRRLHR